MPAFRLGGILLYFAAFKHHIGVYPPVSGEKGNLRFPLGQPMRYDLIERIVKLRESQLRAKAARGGKKGR